VSREEPPEQGGAKGFAGHDDHDALLEFVVSTVPQPYRMRLVALISSSVPLDQGSSTSDGKIRRMLKHPVRSRHLLHVTQTSHPGLGEVLLFALSDWFRRCSGCGTVYRSSADHFGHTPSGALRSRCKRCQAARTRSWYANNRERTLRRVAAYKAREADAGPRPSSDELGDLRRRQGDRCAYCGAELGGAGELDHRVPLARGGSNGVANRSWACRTCNRDKHDKTAEEFLDWRRKRGLRIARGD